MKAFPSLFLIFPHLSISIRTYNILSISKDSHTIGTWPRIVSLIILIQACLHEPIAPDIEIATTFRDLVGHKMSPWLREISHAFPWGFPKMGVPQNGGEWRFVMDNLNQSDGNLDDFWGYAHFRKPPNGLAEQTHPPLVWLGLSECPVWAKSRALHCHPRGCYATNKGDECLAQIWCQVLTALLRYQDATKCSGMSGALSLCQLSNWIKLSNLAMALRKQESVNLIIYHRWSSFSHIVPIQMKFM